ncbi:hypothetical protein OSB04_012894 [Centaurea solstitialis]|uniref:F-box domain-containing protein n=1 Tax=Centaurea solstitialis TaxID=347529 RepID=A0AA38TNX4_9ASTR|nr:hypothetical protein OSB04_012894 [Centaurea solstitialis]
MRKKRHQRAVVDKKKRRRWETLHPEILASIFIRIAPHEMMKRVPFVCKSWNEVVLGPYCWQDIDVSVWCEIRSDNDPDKVDHVLEKLVQRTNHTARQLCTFDMGVRGFSAIANCGRCLISLVMPVGNINDEMVLKHIKPLPNLKYLDISYCFHITHKGIAAFGNNCKSLYDLKRCMPTVPFEEHSSPDDDSEAKAIADTMPNLRWLQLCAGKFGKPGLFEILAKCKLLTHLDIYESWNVDLNDAEFKGITEKLRMFLY